MCQRVLNQPPRYVKICEYLMRSLKKWESQRVATVALSSVKVNKHRNHSSPNVKQPNQRLTGKMFFTPVSKLQQQQKHTVNKQCKYKKMTVKTLHSSKSEFRVKHHYNKPQIKERKLHNYCPTNTHRTDPAELI